jgi:hypothetical protein
MGGPQARENGRMESQDGDEVVGESASEEDQDGPQDSGGFDHWRRESALGAVGTGLARGLQAVFGAPVDEVVIVASVPGDPPDADDRIRVILDLDDPAKSVAIVPPPSGPPKDHPPG